jgi:hypothetical protein
MRRLSEEKFQGWRALAIRSDGTEHLLHLGHSYDQVKSGYQESFLELLTEEEQSAVVKISIDRWNGIADIGTWVRQEAIGVPSILRKKVAV